MRPTQALIHRAHLLHNLDTVRRCVPPGTAVCAAVKADAYGHGALSVARVLVDAGVEALGIATVDEGVALRASGINVPLLLFGSVQPDELGALVDAGIEPFVWTVDAVEALARVARGRAKPLGVHLKVDTGMGRVGCRPDEAEALAQAIVHALPLEFAGLCTHLAASDGPGPLGVDVQLDRFHQALDAVRARGWNPRHVHASNSGAVLSWPGAHFTMVRPGIVLYGYGPRVPTAPLTPVMELVSKVGYVKTVPAGTTISYGSRYVTDRTTDIATVPLGYADGYRRAFTNKAPVVIGGRTFRVSGTVCMDQFLVDVGPDSRVRAGDPVVLFGPQGPTAEDLADLAGTISYEILCGISARVPRIVV
jgi:alanine racemase